MKTFLVCITLDTPKPEHRQIKEKLEQLSLVKPQLVFMTANQLGYLVMTDLHGQQLSGFLDRVVFGEDQVIYLEISRSFAGNGYDAVNSWLSRHHYPRGKSSGGA